MSHDPGDTVGTFPSWGEFAGVRFSGVGEDLAEDPVAELEHSYFDVLVVAPSDLLGVNR